MGICIKEPFISVERALTDLKRGKMIILQDSHDRENEGDIIFFSSKADIEMVRFTTNIARGLLCVAISPEKAQKLGLTLMCSENDSPHGTPFTQSLDAKLTTTTGISIKDRFSTITKLGDSLAYSPDFVKPGHIFPLISNKKGLLGRQGHTEGAVELAKLAGEEEAVAICEILDKGEGMSAGDDIIQFAKEHNLGLLTMEQLIDYDGQISNKSQKQQEDDQYEPQILKSLPTHFGEFAMYAFEQRGEGGEPAFALVSGDINQLENPLVRVHSECLTGDLLGSLRCDCGEQKDQALKRIGEEGGLFIYLRQEGRGIGLIEKLKAYQLQDQGLDTVDANLALGHGVDERVYSQAIKILNYFKIDKIRLMTNNPEKISALEDSGIKVDREAIVIEASQYNKYYLSTKKEKMNHMLTTEIQSAITK